MGEWLLKVLLKIVLKSMKKENVQKTYIAQLEYIAEQLFGSYDYLDSPGKLDKELFIIGFNIKYRSSIENGNPYDKLNSFYAKARNGDRSFIRDPFYRLMRVNRDRETKKLKYILDRNTNG